MIPDTLKDVGINATVLLFYFLLNVITDYGKDIHKILMHIKYILIHIKCFEFTSLESNLLTTFFTVFSNITDSGFLS
jgi:hypothetical protein